MKKLFTILMAVVVAMSVSALPIKRIDAKRDLEKQQINLPTFEKERTAMPQAKTTRAASEMQGKMLAPQAKVASQDFVKLYFDDIARGPEYYEDTQTWDVGLTCYDESKPAYGHIIQLNWRAPKDDFTGTFTTEDFDPDYTWAVTTTCMGYILFDDISMTVSYEEVSENETLLVLKAKMTGSDGFNKNMLLTYMQRKE